MLPTHRKFAFGLDPIDDASDHPTLLPINVTTHQFRYKRRASDGLARVVATVDVTLTPSPAGDKVLVRAKAS